MKQYFGTTCDGQQAFLYEISWGSLKAQITDYGAALVRLYVPDSKGIPDDIVLGFDSVEGYDRHGAYMGATVGRNANRIGKACFTMGEKTVRMEANDNENNLHSGPESYAHRLWQVERHTQDSICFFLHSPSGDQGMPGNASVRVTYTLAYPGELRLSYNAVCDSNTVFNLTNHSYFNLAGHQHPEKAMEQVLMLTSRHCTPADEYSIPTGELRDVAGTAMDFRVPKPIGRDIKADDPCLKRQGGYDHNFEVFTEPFAILTDPGSGRTMTVSTDLPGVQFYSGNYLDVAKGKDGVSYPSRSGIALETQYYPDSVNKPQWKQPFFKAGEPFHSQTVYKFQW